MDNHLTVLASARHKRKADIERLVALLSPKPAVPTVIRKLPIREASRPETCTTEPFFATVSAPEIVRVPVAAPASRPAVTPLAPER